MPWIASACSVASSRFDAILIPPALPRPPIRTCALITAGIADLLGGGDCLLGVASVSALGDLHAVLREELLTLIFE